MCNFRSRARLHHLGTTDIWGCFVLCRGDCLGHCKMLNIQPLPTGFQQHPPQDVIIPSVSRHCPCPLEAGVGATVASVENLRSRVTIEPEVSNSQLTSCGKNQAAVPQAFCIRGLRDKPCRKELPEIQKTPHKRPAGSPSLSP